MLKHRKLAAGLLLGLIAGAAALSAQAHQIWFEQDGKGLTFRYGELEPNMHEVTPGGLDRFVALKATWVDAKGAHPFALAKRQDHFELPAEVRPKPGDSLLAIDESYPMFDSEHDGKPTPTWWVPATRWVGDFSARQATLPLDIVPTGKTHEGKVEFQVSFLGEPLAGERVELAAASGWTFHANTDVDGKVSFSLPWRDTYAVGLYFVDDEDGVRKLPGQAPQPYGLHGYNTTLAFHTATGLPPLPVAPKTLPASELKRLGMPLPKKHD